MKHYARKARLPRFPLHLFGRVPWLDRLLPGCPTFPPPMHTTLTKLGICQGFLPGLSVRALSETGKLLAGPFAADLGS